MSELEDIAKTAGIDVDNSKTQEEIIYAILDKQAEVEGNKNPLGTKRRRTRILKKDTDRVYSVNGKDGENFDLKKNKAVAEQQSLFKESQTQPETSGTSEDVTETAPAPATKRRGRKSLKETAATAEKEADETAETMTADEPEAEQTATGAEEQPEDGKEEENEMNMETSYLKKHMPLPEMEPTTRQTAN